jgi:hypothetical protein
VRIDLAWLLTEQKGCMPLMGGQIVANTIGRFSEDVPHVSAPSVGCNQY